MKTPDIDWTFDEAPARGEPPFRRRPRPPRRTGADGEPGWKAGLLRWRRPILAFLAVAAMAGGGLLAASSYGWWKVRSQIAALVAREDALSSARDSRAVRALQAADAPEWADLRARQAALGLAGPLPAPNLLPLDEPARLLRFHAPAPDVIEVTLARRFADSSGAVFEFEFVQRYRSPAPGRWERTPPDTSALTETKTWSGLRLEAAYPAADAAWLEAVLVQMDSNLQAACQAWDCPDGLSAMLIFSGEWNALAQAGLPPREALGAGERVDDPGGRPVIFDLPPRNGSYSERATRPSPHLSGYPRDALAGEALRRAVTAGLLGQMAEEISRASRADGFFLDALIARAEIRLGLSPEPQFDAGPHNFVRPERLWDTDLPWTPALPLRLQALDFIDFVLARRPAAEAALLRNLTLQHQIGLQDWLVVSLQESRPDDVEAWTRAALARFDYPEPSDWRPLEGLAYACESGAWLVRDGQPQTLPVAGPYTFLPGMFSRDGRRLAALVEAAPAGAQALEWIDLEEDAAAHRLAEPPAWPLGWTGVGQLAYLADTACGDWPCRLVLHDPATGRQQSATLPPVYPPWPAIFGRSSVWSPDRAALALTLLEPVEQAETEYRSAVIRLTPNVRVETLAGASYSPAWSPDGRRIAYIVGGAPWVVGRADTARIEALDLSTGVTTTLFSTDSLPPDGGLTSIMALDWSADSSQLAAVVYGESSSGMLVLPLDGSRPEMWVAGFSPAVLPMGFSADSRFLASFRYADAIPLSVVDLQTGEEARYTADFASAAWSPGGHQLAVGGQAGTYVIDPDTGEITWLSPQTCSVAWYGGP